MDTKRRLPGGLLRATVVAAALFVGGCLLPDGSRPGAESEAARMEPALEERDSIMSELWQEWLDAFDGHSAGDSSLERSGFERRVRTVGAGEELRDLRRDVREFFGSREVRSRASRVVELDALLDTAAERSR